MTEKVEIDNNLLSIPLGFSVFLVQEEASLERGSRPHFLAQFLCFETKRKSLLRRLGAHERKSISQGRKLREISTFELNKGSRLKS